MTESNTFVRQTFPMGPFQCNCTIVGDIASGEAMVVDPSGDVNLIMSKLAENNLAAIAIIQTHAHLDHVFACGELKARTGAPIYLHQNDLFLWENVEMQAQAFGVPFEPVPEVDHWLNDGDTLPVLAGTVIHTPGHTQGSVCFYFEAQKLLVAGDTLFRGAVGRTDLWGGDFNVLQSSIREKLYVLAEETTVVPGHGSDTTIGVEKRQNSVVRA